MADTPAVNNIPTDDRNSYINDCEGNVAKNVVLGGVKDCVEVPTRPTGETGAGTTFKVTTMIVGDTPTKIPAIPLANRTRYSIYNSDLSETLYISDSATVTADSVVGTTSGWEIAASETFNDSILDTLELYGVAPTGKTIKIKVVEAY